ncbi:MAG: sensor histidine kinase [Burkholderiales bacterium]|nr:sensor histidine kinase [Burkholderiales bacterium]
MNSLRNRLSLAASLVLLVAAALLAVGLQEFPRRLVEDYVLSRLQRDADLLYVHIHDAADPIEAAQGAAGTVYELPLSGHYFRISHGDTTIRSRSLWDEELPPVTLDASSERVLRLPGPAHQSLLILAKRFSASDGGWLVVVAEDVSGLDAAIATFRRWLLAGAVLALALLLLLQRWLIVRGLAPLDDAIVACNRLERGEITPIVAKAPAEVRPMLDAVNRLVHYQAQRLARVRHTVGNLSHALKTPLTVLTQAAEEIRTSGNAALAATLQAQLDVMRATIERELRRARLAGAGGAAGGGFEARAQLEDLVGALERLYRERDITIEMAVPERRFPLDREDMLELFGNLLDNACKWARSRVRIEIPPGLADELVFVVEDDGPGLAQEALEHAGAAGMRTDEQPSGHGLGLAIVGDIVAQYGGTIHYARSALLGGLRVDGRLPFGQAAST